MKSKNTKYYSTNHRAAEVTFKEALLTGLAPDGGLYLPDMLPSFEKNELENFSGKEYHEIAYIILNKLIGDEISGDDLRALCRSSYNFDVPVEKIRERKYILRLDQGPTASFKDFAARMMSRLMQHFLSLNNQHLTILTATSGDTGSAVANAFYDLDNINVIILYPVAEVSSMQRRQMTTLKKNIQVIAINGKFDDCQRLVKEAFLDPRLSHMTLSSANSINIGRLLPQSVYYFYAWSRISTGYHDQIIFSVPSGNFGNLMGGIIAQKMGLPVKKFVVTTNENDEVPEFLRTGIYKSIVPSKNCISSAMNVGHPSNLARIVAIYGGEMNEKGVIIKQPDLKRMKEILSGISVTDEETRNTIKYIYGKYNTLLEPHGAVAWYGLNKYLNANIDSSSKKQLCVSIETAHPAKFPDELLHLLEISPPLPTSLTGLDEKEESYLKFENNYQQLREFILRNK